jgi:hypothetical protein
MKLAGSDGGYGSCKVDELAERQVLRGTLAAAWQRRSQQKGQK